MLISNSLWYNVEYNTRPGYRMNRRYIMQTYVFSKFLSSNENDDASARGATALQNHTQQDQDNHWATTSSPAATPAPKWEQSGGEPRELLKRGSHTTTPVVYVGLHCNTTHSTSARTSVSIKFPTYIHLGTKKVREMYVRNIFCQNNYVIIKTLALNSDTHRKSNSVFPT